MTRKDKIAMTSCALRLSPKQQQLFDILSDGQPHLADLRELCSAASLRVHLTMIRREIKRRNLDIVHVHTLGYRLVRNVDRKSVRGMTTEAGTMGRPKGAVDDPAKRS